MGNEYGDGGSPDPDGPDYGTAVSGGGCFFAAETTDSQSSEGIMFPRHFYGQRADKAFSAGRAWQDGSELPAYGMQAGVECGRRDLRLSLSWFPV